MVTHNPIFLSLKTDSGRKFKETDNGDTFVHDTFVGDTFQKQHFYKFLQTISHLTQLKTSEQYFPYFFDNVD